MSIYIASDHRGISLKNYLIAKLEKNNNVIKSDLVNYDTNGKPFIDGLDKRRQLIEAVGEFKKSEDYNGEFDRETVIFLPFKGEHWDNMLPFYYDEINRDNTDVFVIPIPYYYKEHIF